MTGVTTTIVARIATSYGGWVRIGDKPAGPGARVEVWFPAQGA